MLLPLFITVVNGNHRHLIRTSAFYSFTAIVAVCVQPLFGFISDKLVYRKNLMWMLAIIITLFAPYWIYVFAPLLKINVFLGALAGGLYIGMAYGAGCGFAKPTLIKSAAPPVSNLASGADVRRHRRRDRHLCGRKTLRH
jgi:oligosaccharide:H+ symporter